MTFLEISPNGQEYFIVVVKNPSTGFFSIEYPDPHTFQTLNDYSPGNQHLRCSSFIGIHKILISKGFSYCGREEFSIRLDEV